MKAILGNIEGYKVNDSFLFKMGDRPIPFYIKNISNNTINIKVKRQFCHVYYSYDLINWTKKATGSNYQNNFFLLGTIESGATMYMKSTEFKPHYFVSTDYGTVFQITGGECVVGGDLSTLLWGDSLTGTDADVKCLFADCTTITNASELILPNVDNFGNNYKSMFRGCTSLTKAPVIPAKVINDSQNGLEKMFFGCSLLNEVYLNAESISNPSIYGNLYWWLQNTAAAGVIHKKASLTNLLQNSTSGIPSGWTTVDDM